MVDKVDVVQFSPTGTTAKVLAAICQGIGAPIGTHVDLTCNTSAAGLSESDAKLVLIGVPVYSGRLPETALARLEGLEGRGRIAVLLVVYGNRAYDDALLELHDLVKARGFVVGAAAAFVGEHSFSIPETPIAPGRPDPNDLEQARRFGTQLKANLDVAACRQLFTVPGNHPYRAASRLRDLLPIVDASSCTRCGLCLDACPTGAALEDSTRADLCIHCAACVKICPTGARAFEPTRIHSLAARLTSLCSERKEPVWFLPE